jgi:hypothetical protein
VTPRALCVGIGGGGDVAGALAAAGWARAERGMGAVLGGLTWERLPIDALPGPRRLDEVTGLARLLHPAAALAGPQAAGPGDFRFGEGRMAELRGEPVLLVDPNPGPAAVAEGLTAAARELGCPLVVLLDVGGDVLAHGDEAGLASPLADAVLLAAAPALRGAGLEVVLAVFGAGCDGELRPAEVAERLAEVAAAGGDLGTWRPDAGTLEALEAGVGAVRTEASMMALRCARGERGTVPIREGRRTVELTALGGELRLLDPEAALRSAARLAALVQDAPDLAAADALLRARGVRTELQYEQERQASSSAS